MSTTTRPISILMAEDDPEDIMLVRDAMVEARLANELRCVSDGEELMDYLHHRGKYADPQTSPRPGVILLDLNMPKKDGREALREIKADPALRAIPVIVLTTSHAEEDILRSYGTGANSYIAKPVTFEKLVEIVKLIGRYWFEIVELPSEGELNNHGPT
jgi:two-component system, response regulator